MKILIIISAILMTFFACFLCLAFLPASGESLFLICMVFVSGGLLTMLYASDDKKLNV